MGEFQPWHLLVVLVVALLLFGPRKLPELGKGLGEAMRGFKDGIKGAPDATKDTTASTTQPIDPKPIDPK